MTDRCLTGSPDFALPEGIGRARFSDLYSELELYQTLLKTYTKPLFAWRKALSMSHDGRTLYDFARQTPRNAARLHRSLSRQSFRFREGIELRYNFNGRRRDIYLYPWEERIVDLLLYRMLNRHFHEAFSSHTFAYRFRGFGVDRCQHRIRRALDWMSVPLYGFKRDVADYFPSIDHDILIAALKEWVDPDDYLFELIEQRVRFRFWRGDRVCTAGRGVPFGTAIACFLANFYLIPLDRALGSIPGLSYFRYADDTLAFSRDREAALEGIAQFEEMLDQLNLRAKPKHHRDFLLGKESIEDAAFESTSRIRHLGLEFRADGSVGLSRDKFRKICNQFRYAFRRARRKFQRAKTPEQRAELAVEIARDVIERGVRSVAIIDYYLKHVNDEGQLRRLDRWLGEEVLALAFQNGHKKGNWRNLPFRRLREMGLPSLRHRRRLILHGHLETSFFILRTDRLIERERRRLPG